MRRLLLPVAVLLIAFGCSKGNTIDGDELPDGDWIIGDGDTARPDGDQTSDGDSTVPDGDDTADGDGPLTDGDTALPDGDTPPDGDEIDGDQIVSGTPIIGASPSEYDFGAVAAGERLTQEIRLLNYGDGPLVVSSIAIEDASGEMTLEWDRQGMTVAPEGRLPVLVHYAEMDNQNNRESLLVRSNDPRTPELRVPLTSNIKSKPVLDIDPAAIDFGRRRPGGEHRQTVTVRNLGLQDLYLIGVELRPGGSPDFSLDGVPEPVGLDRPWKVEIGSRVEFVAVYRPSLTGPAAGTLVIRSTDEDRTIVSVAISADCVVPDIELVPAVLDFSGIDVGQAGSRDLAIRNVGSDTLNLADIAFGPGTDLDQFSFAQPPDRTAAIAPGDETIVSVLYQPDRPACPGSLAIASDDPDEMLSTVRFVCVPEPPAISVEPDPAVFGQVTIGDRGVVTVLVGNVGGGVLQLDGCMLESMGLTGFALETDCQGALSSGQTMPLDLSFSPIVRGDAEDVLLIESSDLATPVYRLPLEGNGAEPDIEVDPLTLDFSGTVLGEDAVRTLVVTNIGDAPLRIDSIRLGPETDTNEFGFPIAPPAGMLLPPGVPLPIDVEYTPLRLDCIGSLTITSNDPDEHQVTVLFSGEIVEPNACPVAAARVASPAGTVQKGDTLRLDGTISFDPDPQDTIAFHVWSIEARPAGSVAQLSDGNAPQPTLVPDRAGRYSLKLEVRDSRNMLSCRPALLSVDVPDGEIDCSPVRLDYPAVRAGQHQDKAVVCRNVGSGVVVLNGAEVAGGSPPVFLLQGTPPASILPGGSATLTVRYQPIGTAADSGTLRVRSDDADEPLVLIPLAGDGAIPNNCPVAAIVLTSPPAGSIRQGDTVRLDGTGSRDPDGDPISSYQWSVTTRPAGSSAALSSTTASLTSLVADRAGGYTVRLEVRDSQNTPSCTPATLSFTAASPPPMSGDPAAIGHFVNVMTGDVIAGAYWQMKNGAAVIATSGMSNSSGDATISGSYLVQRYTGHVPTGQAALGQFVCPDVPFDLITGGTARVTFSCQPPLPSGSLRIVLHWDNWRRGGADLDAHTWVPTVSGHRDVYYSSRSYNGTVLDHDGGIQGFFDGEPSPETVTVSNLVTDGSGIYCYSIHDFNYTRSAWHGRNSFVQVFDSNGLYVTINGPAEGSGAASWWHVLRIDARTRQITVVNTRDTGAPNCP